MHPVVLEFDSSDLLVSSRTPVLYNTYNDLEVSAVSKQSFGSFFKECRIRRGQSLRSFCSSHGFDPGNISKLERGRLAPPSTEEKLGEYARALGLESGSADWYEFFDRAAAERGRLPHDLLSDAELLGKLPALFRTLRGNQCDAEKLDDFVERIRRA